MYWPKRSVLRHKMKSNIYPIFSTAPQSASNILGKTLFCGENMQAFLKNLFDGRFLGGL